MKCRMTRERKTPEQHRMQHQSQMGGTNRSGWSQGLRLIPPPGYQLVCRPCGVREGGAPRGRQQLKQQMPTMLKANLPARCHESGMLDAISAWRTSACCVAISACRLHACSICDQCLFNKTTHMYLLIFTWVGGGKELLGVTGGYWGVDLGRDWGNYGIHFKHSHVLFWVSINWKGGILHSITCILSTCHLNDWDRALRSHGGSSVHHLIYRDVRACRSAGTVGEWCTRTLLEADDNGEQHLAGKVAADAEEGVSKHAPAKNPPAILRWMVGGHTGGIQPSSRETAVVPGGSWGGGPKTPQVKRPKSLSRANGGYARLREAQGPLPACQPPRSV